jgi:hypothetical protein
MHADYHCNHEPSEDAEHSTFHAAVEAAVIAFMSEVGAPFGSVLTIRAQATEIEDSDDVIVELTIGIGPKAHESIAAQFVIDELTEPGSPRNN